MTLCVAWRFQNKICIASDSRITSPGVGYLDIGTKVLECPIRIISPVNRHTGNYDVLHESTVGLCFCGPLMPGYLIKEHIAEVLFKLQFAGSLTQLTFEKIAEVAFKVFKHAIRRI